MRITVQEVLKENAIPDGDVLTKAICAWMPPTQQSTRFVQNGIVTFYSKKPLGLKPDDELVGRMEFRVGCFEQKYYNYITFDIENADDNSQQV